MDSKPVVKLEQTELPILPFSNATNREKIGVSDSTAEVSEPLKVEPGSIKMELEENTVKQELASEKTKKSAASIRENHSIFGSPEDIAYTPEGFLKEGIKMVKTIKAHVKRLEIGSKLRKDVWLREISSLESQGSPSTMIAVCGATGAGKSSALNAILDANIVPTSGMRACTAVVTEISYHKEKTIEADVSFLSEKEWRDELEVLLEDLLDDDGTFRRTTDLRSEAGVAWHKVHALYPTLTQERLASIARRNPNERIDAILNVDLKIKQLMGSTKKIVARNAKMFAKEIAKYIDSKDEKRGKKKDKEKKKKSESGPALWPLIRQVNVRCNSRALSTGAVLVDLPGVADANAARSSIARDYMKKADCVWVLAPITRAVDDKTAKDLLGDAFKSQLMNGGFSDVESTITFIATKCDDISCSEVIGSLSLEDDPVLEEREGRISSIKAELKEMKLIKAGAEKGSKGINEELRIIREELAQDREHLKALGEGRTFVPSKPAKSTKKSNGKKRKNSHGEKDGSPKRRKGDQDEAKEAEMVFDPHADEDEGTSSDDDFIDGDPIESVVSESVASKSDPDSDSESDSDSDSESDPDSDSESDSDSDSESDSDSDSDSDSESDSDSDSESDSDSDSESDSDSSTSSDDDKSDLDEDADELISDTSQPEDVGGSITRDEVKARIEQKNEELKGARIRLSEFRNQRKQAMDVIAKLTEKQTHAQREKNAFCSLKRSEFSREVLKEDFRNGLKELDDAAEEKQNPTGFDPSVDLRNYDSINLPVFTISSRDYIRITKQVKGDGDPSCFTYTQDTGIPDLQQWCHSLTIKSREKAARNFRNQLRVFAMSIKSYIDSFGMVSEADRETLRAKWESTPEEVLYTMYDSGDEDESDDGYGWVYQHGRLIPIARGRSNVPTTGGNKRHKDGEGIVGRLNEEFAEVVSSGVKGMQRAFQDGLEEKCQVGADAAAGSAVEISDAFAASMHWSTYRATLRRDGVWRRNLNEELISPMTKMIASSWAKTFETNLFSEFEQKSLEAISRLLQEVEESCPAALRDRAHHQTLLCLEEVKVALRKTIDVVSLELTSGQKEVSRCLEPHVIDRLSDGYSLALEERGRGSVARQKTVFRNYVNSNKDDLFEDGAELILDKLDKIAISVGKALEVSMNSLAEKIEVNLAVLWESASDGSVQLLKERTEAVKCIDSILRQLLLWDRADKERETPAFTEN